VSLELPEPIVPDEPVELELLLPEVEGLAPIVPLLLLGELDELELEDGVLAEPDEPAVAGVLEEDEEDGVELEEPLAPMDVPLLLGVLDDEVDESLLAAGVLLDELLGVLLEEELLGVLEPEAPIVPVDGVVAEEPVEAPAAGPAPPALPLPLPVAEAPLLPEPLVPPLAPALWARA